MMGRRVGEALQHRPPQSLFAPELVAAVREADLVLLNLECCISERGEPAAKTFTFRAPPVAVEALVHLGVDCVTLANNHALDYGPDALLDTREHLRAAGIVTVGAGEDEAAARAPALLEAAGVRVGVLAVTDHPRSFAAGPARPGVAHADLTRGVPGWLLEAVGAIDAEACLVTAHWGPNMTSEPLPYVRAAARALREAGATLVAGHSAHVFHGAGDAVLYDLGDFLDDYAVDPRLRNDRGLLFLVELDGRGATRLEALPIALEYTHTRVARGDEAAWVRERFHAACAGLGTEARDEDGRLVVDWT
jgi:poly-gamma-glutamate capsule biosynthesis protein CapA/YwtB (metallophosphatase superfamily)